MNDALDIVGALLYFSVEKVKGSGEDHEQHCICKPAAMVSVFDGCGGAGGKKYPKLHNKTGAYTAANAAAAAFTDWFRSSGYKGGSIEELKGRVVDNLKACESLIGEQSQLVGKMSKRFPTTAASAVLRPNGRGMYIDLYWAGDSRVYLLNGYGLAQLTEDDLDGVDAMENISEDGALANLISLSRDFTINHGCIEANGPCLIFAATDGCFGYISTPMEFEYMLLETMMGSSSVAEWEEKLREAIGGVSGDDYSMSMMILNYKSFKELKEELRPRKEGLFSACIKGLKGKNHEEKTALWLTYRDNYYRLLCQGGN